MTLAGKTQSVQAATSGPCTRHDQLFMAATRPERDSEDHRCCTAHVDRV